MVAPLLFALPPDIVQPIPLVQSESVSNVPLVTSSSPKPPAGGDKTRQLPITTGILDSPTGRFKDVTEAEYWDSMYGETHNPENGRPKLPALES